MTKIAIVSDSTGSIPTSEQEQFNIYTNYLSIIFGTEAYREFKEITPETFIERCEAYPELPTTSQPTPGVLVELYESLLEKGYDHIIHITLSSQLSGSYQTAVTCRDMVDSNRITVFDSKTVTYTQGMFAIFAAQKVEAGASLDEVLSYLEMIRENNEFYAAVYDLTNLRKGGRLSNVEATLGGWLQIKPIIHIEPDGTLQPAAKIRTFKKSLKKLVEFATAANLTDDYQIAVMHIGNLEGAETVQQELKQVYPNHEIGIYSISLVVAVHGGPGAVALGWVKKK